MNAYSRKFEMAIWSGATSDELEHDMCGERGSFSKRRLSGESITATQQTLFLLLRDAKSSLAVRVGTSCS